MSTDLNSSGEQSGVRSDNSLEERAHTATVAGFRVARRTLVWTIVGIIVAALSGVFAFLQLVDDKPTQSVEGSANQVVQGGGAITNNYFREVDEFKGALPPNPGAAQIRKSAEQYAEVNPDGTGPWPFVVVADPNLGLKVRTTGTTDGVQVGTAAYNTSVWVECRKDTGFNPAPGDPNGAMWYRVKWPSEQSTSRFYNSSPGDRFDQWVYGGLIVPIGQNGKVPACL